MLFRSLGSYLSMLYSIGSAFINYLLIPFKILWNVIIGVMSAIFNFNDSASGTIDVFSMMKDGIDFVVKNFKMLMNVIKSVMAGINGFIDSITSGIGGALVSALTGDFSGAADKIMNLGSDAGKGFMNGFNNELSSGKVDIGVDSLKKQLERLNEFKIKVSAVSNLGNIV